MTDSDKFDKQQYREANVAHKISQIQFSLFSKQQMEQQAHLQVVSERIYTGADEGRKLPATDGVLDRRMGMSTVKGVCDTCGNELARCLGHYGYVDLAFPVFHTGYFKDITKILQCMCKSCSRILLDTDEVSYFTPKLRRVINSPVARKAILKNVLLFARKHSHCPYCSKLNGVVKTAKKFGFMKLLHNPFNPTGRKFSGVEHATFLEKFSQAKENNKELEKHLDKALDLLTPLKVLHIFQNVRDDDCIFIGMTPGHGRPEDLLLQRILVPPPCIRPSVQTDIGGSNEDDITIKITDIIRVNCIIHSLLKHNGPMNKIMELWDSLQIQCALLINSGVSLPSNVQVPKLRRSFVHRLKGKHGRFRGNLSGKRVDFSGRTVISPDPNLRVDEVAVPIEVAILMTYPERVNSHNIEFLRKLILNGPDNHPGANYVIPKAKQHQQQSEIAKTYLRYGNREKIAQHLSLGSIVERHMMDGDIVLFNRQPSLHKLSIMTHYARVMPHRTFRLNECVCTPYNADFDGDEMNLHLPQSEEAKAEALALMGVKCNLVTPRNGEPLIAAIQDFITGSYLLTQKDEFFDRAHFIQLICSFLKQDDADLRIDLPKPSIIKPRRFWTGKQVISVLLRPNRSAGHPINIRAPGKQYSGRNFEELCPNDSFLVVYNGELMAGALDKSMIGSGSKSNIFYTQLRDYSEDSAITCMTRLARLISYYLMNRGFSIGIGDVWPGEQLMLKKGKLVDQGYSKCQDYIQEFREGKLQTQPGMSAEETLEAIINKELSSVREHAGKACKEELHPSNAPLIMALCGAKGSWLNISQMIACVGQQAISGKRMPNGFTERSLPHFARMSKEADAKGFVENSFFSGMTPIEFYFHTVGGREGLVDTAVKTAETGYMQRRLVKALEDMCVLYDLTVRDSNNNVIQFEYGGDNMDPAMMEADNKVLEFERVLFHIQQVFNDRTLPLVSIATLDNTIESFKSDPKYLKCNQKLIKSLIEFLSSKIENVVILEKSYQTDPNFVINNKNYMNEIQLKVFIETVYHKLMKANIDPGTAVGALAAQSIGEPATQMTLKTFHFAGLASMNITLGVPRIKEIINATKSISTPIITAELDVNDSEDFARIVKGRIEKTTLGEVTKCIEEVYGSGKQFLRIRLDLERIKLLKLEIDVDKVYQRIMLASGLKIKTMDVSIRGESIILISPLPPYKEPVNCILRNFKEKLINLVVLGLSAVNRVIINADEEQSSEGKEKYKLYVEGENLRAVMATIGVKGTHSKSNSMIEVEKTLGIEAARSVIVDEIIYTMKNHGIHLDGRHVMLLADLMTYKGEVLGITRFGLSKMKESVLMLASFECTTDHLFNASLFSQVDAINGVSECIIMGLPMKLGTGLFKILYDLPKPKFTPRKLLFSNPDFHILK
ncbi:DNA-directed RNA polymerase III subunit RPC1 [Oopsacas minuta]|uniref:DNA-directed RNA polymerase subunit n=1 Tax=Oopsacas minuta TaxID=111878 RepID=A0AAV7K5I8_9METZ|nr:DNA-directed RNA polymerase III subunit RPC1 [Oopsacas minuta]